MKRKIKGYTSITFVQEKHHTVLIYVSSQESTYLSIKQVQLNLIQTANEVSNKLISIAP